jgi:hypothetical protein
MNPQTNVNAQPSFDVQKRKSVPTKTVNITCAGRHTQYGRRVPAGLAFYDMASTARSIAA